MIVSIAGLALLLLSLFALALQRFYSSVPAKELKRLATRGDHLAAALYRPVAYGASMRLFLWFIFGMSLVFGVLCITGGLVAPAAFVVIGLVVVAIIFLQSIRLTVHSVRLAVHVAPILSWTLHHLHPVLDRAASLVNRFRTHAAHSGLYEKEDIMALIRQQKEQLDNRISHRDLEILERAAQFDERQAADVVLPMSRVRMVRVDDHIGPILLQELHDSGQGSFLAYAESPEHVVGTLFLRDAVQAREGGRVSDVVRPNLAFVHEDFSLRQVLTAFARTSQFMVVVINSFEEAVGVITLEQLLTQLIGETPQEDAIPYENRAAVAAYKPTVPEIEANQQETVAEAGEPAEPAEPAVEPIVASSPEATEVVE
jgi:CBS domain containing-hemolysin-like protein